MITTCERCGEPIYHGERCAFCGRFVCQNCIKATKKLNSTKKRFSICKDCWGVIERRKAWKSAL